MEVTGIILAGGKSSRMGVDKGLMLFEDEPMIAHIISTLKKVTSKIIIISKNKEYEAFGFPVFADIIANKGPLGGIYTGLSKSPSEVNIFVSCDTPFLTEDLFKWLLEKSADNQITIPSKEGKRNPVIGIYKKGILPELKVLLEKDKLKMMDAVSQLEGNVFELPKQIEDSHSGASIFYNVNTKEDFENAVTIKKKNTEK